MMFISPMIILAVKDRFQKNIMASKHITAPKTILHKNTLLIREPMMEDNIPFKELMHKGMQTKERTQKDIITFKEPMHKVMDTKGHCHRVIITPKVMAITNPYPNIIMAVRELTHVATATKDLFHKNIREVTPLMVNLAVKKITCTDTLRVRVHTCKDRQLIMAISPKDIRTRNMATKEVTHNNLQVALDIHHKNTLEAKEVTLKNVQVVLDITHKDNLVDKALSLKDILEATQSNLQVAQDITHKDRRLVNVRSLEDTLIAREVTHNIL